MNQQYYQQPMMQQPMMGGYQQPMAPNMMGQPQQNGYTYTVARPQPANSQPLTPEIANQLRQDGSNLDMKVDQKDLWRAICTHKDPTTGASTLSQNQDGTFTCSICGETFNFFEGSTDAVADAVKVLIDMFQTAKTIYMDAPVKMTEQYYQMIALLRKFPLMWDHACKNMEKYAAYNNPVAPVGSYYSGFNALTNLLNNPYGYQQSAYQQQMYQQPMMQQPMMGGQMYQQPMMGGQMYQQPMMDPNANPMAYGAPAAPAPGVMPQAPAPTAAPAQQAPAAATPANGNEIQQQKVYNV